MPIAADPVHLLALQFPSDPQLSPDGQRVAFVLTAIEEEDPRQIDPQWPKPRYRSRLYWSSGGPAGPLTHITSGAGDSSPRWSPDGTQLAFVRSHQDGAGSLMLLPLSGGEARPLVRFKRGLSQLQWSPDGRTLSFLSLGDLEDRRDERGEPRVITKPLYRANGVDFLPEAPARLWRYDLERAELKTWYSPAVSISSYQWWPDSRGVVFISSLGDWEASRWQQEAFDLDGTGEVRPLTRWGTLLRAAIPHPDGRRLALWGRAAEAGNSRYSRLFLWDAGEVEPLTQAYDAFLGQAVNGDAQVGALPDVPTWLNADTLLFSSTVRGSSGLFTVNLKGEVRAAEHHPEQVISAFTANAHGTALIREAADHFPEVELNGRAVTSLHQQLPFTVLTPQEVQFETPLGPGQGWVLKPPGPGPFPALLSIHGGPHTDYGHTFMHEFQTLAAQGYAVCYSNPRGSAGSGEAWFRDIYGRWGSVDADDLLKFFDQCLTWPELDSSRTAVLGGSYGGYMVNWLTSHTTRFQAAITDRCICNLISFAGTSDVGLRFWQEELGLDFTRRADAEQLWNLSPLRYVEQVQTPTLIVHAVLDHRCPISEAEQWYSALQLNRVPVRLVRYPGEHHELSRAGRPDRRLSRLREYVQWLAQWLRPDPEPVG